MRATAARRSAGALGTATVIVKDVLGARRRGDEPFWMLCGWGHSARAP